MFVINRGQAANFLRLGNSYKKARTRGPLYMRVGHWYAPRHYQLFRHAAGATLQRRQSPVLTVIRTIGVVQRPVSGHQPKGLFQPPPTTMAIDC